MKVFILILIIINSIFAMATMANSKDKEAGELVKGSVGYYFCLAAVAIAVNAGMIYLFMRV